MHHLVGAAEIAEMLGVSRQRVNQVAKGDYGFPAPEAVLKAGNVWSKEEVVKWMANPANAQFVKRAKGTGRIFERFTDRARRLIVESQSAARDLHHPYIGTEHLAIAITEASDDLACAVLADTLSGTPEEYRAWVLERCPADPDGPPKGHLPFTPRLKRVMEKALQLSGGGTVEPGHLMVAVASDPDGLAAQMFEQFGVSYDGVAGIWERTRTS